ncbi:MAG TPA: hypothetical protein VMM15_30365 [Bradyrhizobium sp.]|nr:hypothetical protein [Bradyrhizobium sp.]
MLAHLPHLAGERANIAQERRIFEISKDLVTIGDAVKVVERRVEERLQIVFRLGGRGILDDLIKIQIAKEGRRFGRCFAPAVAHVREENAAERHGGLSQYPDRARPACASREDEAVFG